MYDQAMVHIVFKFNRTLCKISSINVVSVLSRSFLYCCEWQRQNTLICKWQWQNTFKFANYKGRIKIVISLLDRWMVFLSIKSQFLCEWSNVYKNAISMETRRGSHVCFFFYFSRLYFLFLIFAFSFIFGDSYIKFKISV